MPSPPPNRGTVFIQGWEQRIVEEREAVVTTVACKWCEEQKKTKPWGMTGTVAETRAAYLEHRTAEHPEVKPKPRRKRMRPFGQLSNRRTLDENIANARGQGASTWAGDL